MNRLIRQINQNTEPLKKKIKINPPEELQSDEAIFPDCVGCLGVILGKYVLMSDVIYTANAKVNSLKIIAGVNNKALKYECAETIFSKSHTFKEDWGFLNLKQDYHTASLLGEVEEQLENYFKELNPELIYTWKSAVFKTNTIGADKFLNFKITPWTKNVDAFKLQNPEQYALGLTYKISGLNIYLDRNQMLIVTPKVFVNKLEYIKVE